MTQLELEDIKTIAELPYNWDKLSNKRILVSGGTGLIGSFLSEVIDYRNKHYSQNIKIISLSRRGGLNTKTVEHMSIDITKPFSVSPDIDYILHLASNTHPKQYAEDPVGTIVTNVYGCDNLLKIAKEKNAKFLLASSVEIYGQGIDKHLDENYCGYINCNQTRSGYNEAKRVCESLVQSYRSQYGIQAVIARLSRVFGPDKKVDTKALAQFMDKAVLGEDIVLKSKGNQRFSYCYIADAVSAIIKLLLDGCDGEAYNISDDDDGTTLGEYAEYIAHLANKKVIYDIQDNPAASKATYALLDTSKIKGIGWKPLYSIKDGLKRTYLIKREH